MGKALKQTPAAWVWATAIVIAYLLAGVMIGLVAAADGEQSVLVTALVVGVAGLACVQAAKRAEWLASTRIGRWWWHVAIWFCADDAIEREEMLEKLPNVNEDSDHAIGVMILLAAAASVATASVVVITGIPVEAFALAIIFAVMFLVASVAYVVARDAVRNRGETS
jgi:hypothetical protein